MAETIVLDPRAHDLTGHRFGRLTAVRPVDSLGGYVLWECRCECGGAITVPSKNLAGQRTTHCGCRSQKRGTAANEYRTWEGMKHRCSNPRNKRYPMYGARGIYVCDRWRESFDAFIADMGPCPPGMSLDRIDNDGPYSPENCRWASAVVQSRNSRHNRLLTFQGKTQCLIEWAEETGINADAIYGRLKLGWPIERTLTEPIKPGRRKKS